MSGARYDAVVVGGGHNGLVCAAYLARAGIRTLLLERRRVVGGALATEHLEPGLRVPAVAHTAGRLRPSIVRDLRLHEHGLRFIRPAVRAFAPSPDGPAVTLWSDPARTAEGLRALSSPDAASYIRFDRRVRSLASFLAHLAVTTPPDVAAPSLPDAMAGLKLASAFRRMGPKAGRELLRVFPMAVADLVGEAFQSDPVRAAIASRGIRHVAMGPWSAGTAAVLLSDSAGNDGGAAGETAFVRGGPAALTEAMAAAARSFGAEIRTDAPVLAITTSEERATGVALASGEEIPARVVVSGLDPKRTLLGLVDPAVLGPTMVWRARNLRLPGVVAKVNLALAELPRFVDADPERLSGRILLAPGIDHLERAFDHAKYGRVSDGPFLEATIPTLLDPSLAPEGRHAMSVLVQYVPYHLRAGEWAGGGETLGDLVLKTLEDIAPGISGVVTARQVITPADLESDFGLTEGHPLHGEPSLDQFFAWRPLFGYARYRLPVDGLYLCGSGAHPGGGITGGPGANAAREIVADRRRRARPVRGR